MKHHHFPMVFLWFSYGFLWFSCHLNFQARLPGFLVPALTLSSSASVVDAAAEMTTLVEELMKSWLFYGFLTMELE